MKIAILGGGFTGLAAAYRLLKLGHNVTIIEKQPDLGGLAVGFREKNWDWSLEKAYHHWFTNDEFILNLAREINHKVIITRPQTAVLVKDQLFPFDSPLALLKFSPLPLLDRLRIGLVLAFLRFTNNYHQFENIPALSWLRRWMGSKSVDLIWEPLFIGKFGDYKEEITLSWFWARIKKRTSSLAYPEGGFKVFIDHLGEEVRKLGGEILVDTEVTEISSTETNVTVKSLEKTYQFDKLISTLPSPIFTKITPDLPKNYATRINSIPHLWAQNLILVLDKPFFKEKIYWLNITEKNWPFLVLNEHTNFIESKHYHNKHIVYIGNYLPQGHLFIKLTKEELLKKFEPYLRKLSTSYQQPVTSHLFTAPFAQPVVTIDYHKKIPGFVSPLKNIYIANMDMVYPWDRGTNYAVELGYKVADMIEN